MVSNSGNLEGGKTNDSEMNAKTNYFLIIFCATALLSLLLSGCNSKTLEAQWVESSTLTNGEPDWWNMRAYSTPEWGGRMVIANDGGMLYLGAYSGDPRFAFRLREQGLTLTLTNAENKRERVTIHYPMGKRNMPRRPPDQNFLPSDNLPSGEIFDMLEKQSDDAEIIAPDSAKSGIKNLIETEQLGISPQVTESEHSTEYTLRLKTAALAPWLKPGAKVVLKVESPAMKEPRERPGRGGGGMPFGGRGGREGGGPGGGMGGRGMGRDGNRETMDKDSLSQGIPNHKAIDLEFTVRLATDPSLPDGK